MENLYSKMLKNLEETETFLDTHEPLQLNQEYINNLDL